jgi:hypothetical protein
MEKVVFEPLNWNLISDWKVGIAVAWHYGF